MKKLFKEDEFDKIKFELMDKIYPTEALNSYFNFGIAQTLSTLTDIANQYINGNYSDQMDAYDLKKLIIELMNQNPETRRMYGRLRKDGIQVNKNTETP
ncbi:hypothetical protein [Bacillus infantis]|uniref:hypothetical protein n=1 Tax=Bacillus infantis TaxID=324767 RepID=UPI00209DF87F|nr:hypothetical protein [Bacillus infantis]MCP1159328.1 hypothetical protein [Bacillus infantis]